MWLKAPNINCTHGFSTREGGVSTDSFHGLNLGGSEDDPKLILQNRTLALSELGLRLDDLCNLKQVHGTTVKNAIIGQQEGDALVTNEPGLILAVSVADCFPVLFFDEENVVIGAAHAGWRGTVGRIVEKTIDEMIKLGAEVDHIKVAIGQGICKTHFEVGPEVTEEFRQVGFPEQFLTNNKIDLAGCNRFVLLDNGIDKRNIWTMNRCSFEPELYSYRRDKATTGRMWGLISLK
ncbi:MAG: peptidoglycan editing factor PgeF [Bacteroidota bacterium]|nr:peptidoglycan editing factor PgeF [Bacteroidota bacterium]